MRRGSVLGWTVRPQQVALAGIIVLGAALRLAGIGNGLPVLLYNDETVLVQNAMHISWLDLNPHLFVWGSLPFYIVKLVTFTAGAIVPILTGHAPDDFLVTRLLSAVFSLATLPLLHGLGRRISGQAAGFVAALLFALSSHMVEVSHYASLEPMTTFWVTLSAVGMVRWLDGDARGRALAAIAAGLAIATKYNGALLLAPLTLIALTMMRKPDPSRDRQRLVLYMIALIAGTTGLALVWALRDMILRLASTWSNSGILHPVYYQIFDGLLSAALVVLSAGWLFGLAALWRRADACPERRPALGWTSAEGAHFAASPGQRAMATIRMMTSGAPWIPWLLAATAFIMVSPYAVLDFPAFTQGTFFDLAQQSLGAMSGFPPDSRSYTAAAADAVRLDYLFYLRSTVLDLGLPAVGCILIGAWHLWRSARRALLPLALPPFLLILLATLGRNYGLRYLFPVWGLLALLAGIGFGALMAASQDRLKPAWLPVVAAGVLGVIVCWPALDMSLQLLQYRFLQPDTRPAAYEWIVRNLPAGANILREREATTAQDTPELERLTDRFRTSAISFPFETTSLSQWKARGVEYIVLSDSRRQFYAAHSAQFTDVLAEYQRLKTEGRLLHAIEPDAAVQGPPIYIYALP